MAVSFVLFLTLKTLKTTYSYSIHLDMYTKLPKNLKMKDLISVRFCLCNPWNILFCFRLNLEIYIRFL